MRAADLTLSPVHKAAVGRLHPQRGVAMRFPRFVRMRDDKGPLDATRAEEVVTMYGKQVRKVAPPGGHPAGSGEEAPEGVAESKGEGHGDVQEDSNGDAAQTHEDKAAKIEGEDGFWNDVA